jgi:hypothetical protein
MKNLLTYSLILGAGLLGTLEIAQVEVSRLIYGPLVLALFLCTLALLIEHFRPGAITNLADSGPGEEFRLFAGDFVLKVCLPILAGSVLGFLTSVFINQIIVENFMLVIVSILGGIGIGVLLGELSFAIRTGIITMLIVGMANSAIAAAFLFYAFLGLAWALTIYFIDHTL